MMRHHNRVLNCRTLLTLNIRVTEPSALSRDSFNDTHVNIISNAVSLKGDNLSRWLHAQPWLVQNIVRDDMQATVRSENAPSPCHTLSQI